MYFIWSGNSGYCVSVYKRVLYTVCPLHTASFSRSLTQLIKTPSTFLHFKLILTEYTRLTFIIHFHLHTTVHTYLFVPCSSCVLAAVYSRFCIWYCIKMKHTLVLYTKEDQKRHKYIHNILKHINECIKTQINKLSLKGSTEYKCFKNVSIRSMHFHLIFSISFNLID